MSIYTERKKTNLGEEDRLKDLLDYQNCTTPKREYEGNATANLQGERELHEYIRYPSPMCTVERRAVEITRHWSDMREDFTAEIVERGSTYHRHQKSELGISTYTRAQPTWSEDNGLSAGEISKWLCRNCAKASRCLFAFVCQRIDIFLIPQEPVERKGNNDLGRGTVILGAFQIHEQMKNHPFLSREYYIV